MSKAEALIEEAILYAIDNGVKIVGGGCVFDWCVHNGVYSTSRADYPLACNALGAVLLKLGELNYQSNPNWLNKISNYLGVDLFWINRFVLGFDYKTQLMVFISDKDKKCEKEKKDDVSKFGIKLYSKYSSRK